MAFTKCPHCDGRHFEVKEGEPKGAAFKHTYVQCSGCGAPFAANDYFNLGHLLQEQEKQIAALSQQVHSIASTVDWIAGKLR